MEPNYNLIMYNAFYDEVEKYAELEKEAIFETLRVGVKALKASLLGGTKLKAGGTGMFAEARNQAASHGTDMIKNMRNSGIKIHRARIKSPESIAANAAKNPKAANVPDDLLGMQLYGKGPKDIQKVLGHLKEQGANIKSVSPHARPGYHGVNIKGVHNEVPFEVQISPSRRSNMGQIMEHSLGYKPATEAPLSNVFDRWFGRKVAPKMVQQGSWIPQHSDAIKQLGNAAVKGA